jgi:hypothetical protein
LGYFTYVQKGDKVFGMVYGKGVVRNVFGNDSKYTFEVEYETNDQVVPYTEEGVPAWSNKDYQTVYYSKDIDIMDLNITPVNLDKPLNPKKIIKLRNKQQLEVKCSSGIWTNYKECDQNLVEQYLEEDKFYLFREVIRKKNK